MKVLILFIYILISSSFGRVRLIDSTIIGQINTTLYLLIFIYSLYARTRVDIGGNYTKYINIFCFLPLLSIIGALWFYSQSPIDTARAWLKVCSIWMLPYTLYLLKYSKSDIYKPIMLYAICYGIISLAISFSQEIAFLFARVSDYSGELEIRNGQIRVTLPGASLVVFSYIYTFHRFSSKVFSKFDILTLVMCIVAIYMMQTRQIFVAVGIISLYICIKNKKNRKFSILIIALTTLYLYLNFNELFGDFTEQTNNELKNEDYSRWGSYRFYFNKISDNIITLFTGFGQAAPNTYYSQVTTGWAKNSGIGAQDIGFIGTTFYFGVLYIYYYFQMVFRVGWKLRKKISPEISFFILCTFIYSVFIFPFSESGLHATLWSMLFYILILENKKKHIMYQSNNCKRKKHENSTHRIRFRQPDAELLRIHRSENLASGRGDLH